MRGEAPIASHLLFPGILDDDVADERELGIKAGLAWLVIAEASVVYVDHGISAGMRQGSRRPKRWAFRSNTESSITGAEPVIEPQAVLTAWPSINGAEAVQKASAGSAIQACRVLPPALIPRGLG
jgi:hypothetical protein